MTFIHPVTHRYARLARMDLLGGCEVAQLLRDEVCE